MKKHLTWLWLLLLAVGCSDPYPGYNLDNAGFYYKLHALGEGKQPIQNEDYILSYLVYASATNPTLMMHHDSAYFYKDVQKGILGKMLSYMREGDSASFIMPVSLFQPSRLDSNLNDSVMIAVGVHDVLGQEEYKAYVEKLAWKRDQEMNEAIAINDFMMRTELRPIYDLHGMKFVPIEEGKGMKVQNGRDVVVEYTAKFLDGTVFDSSRGEHQQPLEFQVGAPGQVVLGLEMGLKELYKGGKAVFIMPSQFAFGERGVPAGGVPPFTPVIYEVEVVDVK